MRDEHGAAAAHDDTGEPGVIARRAVRGSVWAAIGAYSTFVINFAGIAVLARHVSPAAFGTYALAQSYYEIFGAIGLLPFSQAVVQLGSLPAIADTALIMAVVVRVALLLLSIPVALVVAHYNGRTVAMIFVLLGVVYIFDSIRSSMASVMERDLHYRGLSAAKMVSGIGASVVAVCAGVLGLGTYALVLRDALMVLFVVGIYVANARRWRLPTGRSFDRDTARRVWRFAKSLFWVRSLDQVLARADRALLGNVLGLEGLGYFHQSKYLASLPQSAMAPATMQVAIATYSRVRDDRPRLGRAFELVQYFVLRVVPIVGLAAVLFPEEILRTLYGARWLPAAPTFRVLGIYATLLPILENYRSFATALQEWARLRWSIIAQGVLLVLALVLLAPRYGVIGAAWATCLAPLAALATLRPLVSRRVESLHGSVSPVMLAVALALAAGWGAHRLLVGEGATKLLVVKFGTVVVVYLLSLVAADRRRLLERFGSLTHAWK